MNSIVSRFNDTLQFWKEQYDLSNAVHSSFAIENEFLCFDGWPLCQANTVTVFHSAEVAADGIQFFLGDDRSIIITIEWPEDMGPVVSSVSVLYLLASADIFSIE